MEKKLATAETFDSYRLMVKYLNENQIQKEDIIAINNRGDMVVLVYYGR